MIVAPVRVMFVTFSPVIAIGTVTLTVASVESSVDRHVVYVEDADAFVAALVHSGVSFRELEVTPVSLEDAFVTLTRGAGG